MERIKGEHGVKRQVEKRIRRDVPDELWLKLDPEEWIEPVVDRAPGALEDLTSQIQMILAAFDEGRSRVARVRLTRADRRDTSRWASPDENRIAELCATEVVRQASCDSSVERFRTEYLNGESVSSEQAAQILSMPASCLLSARRFREMGLSLTDDHSAIVDQGWRLESPGPLVWNYDILIKSAEHERTEYVEVSSHLLREVPLPSAPLVRQACRSETLRIARGSVLDILFTTGDHVATRYLWELGDAAWFILTGVPPMMPAVEGEIQERRSTFHTDARITLVIRHWVSPQSVEQMYRGIQRSMLGKRFRPLKAEQIEKFAFVEEKRESDGERRSWQSLYLEWCKKHRKRDDGKWKSFARDYGRTRQAMMPAQIPISTKSVGKLRTAKPRPSTTKSTNSKRARPIRPRKKSGKETRTTR